jgi:aspartate/tyrosine/aromatic aminotransferase
MAFQVTLILSNPSLFEEWKADIVVMASRIISLRKKLVELLEAKGTPGSWKHITEQIGMFRLVCFCLLWSDRLLTKMDPALPG